jgi:hypothetical protein
LREETQPGKSLSATVVGVRRRGHVLPARAVRGIARAHDLLCRLAARVVADERLASCLRSAGHVADGWDTL